MTVVFKLKEALLLVNLLKNLIFTFRDRAVKTYHRGYSWLCPKLRQLYGTPGIEPGVSCIQGMCLT